MMAIGRRALAAVCSFPPIMGFSRQSQEKASERFARAGIHDIDAAKYLSGSFTISLAFFLASLLALLLFLSLFEALGAALLLFALLFAGLLSVPRALAMQTEKQIEAELPFLLREIAVYIDIGLPFEKSLAKIAARDYALSPDFAECCKSMKAGANVQSSLAHMASRSSSLPVKRSLLLLSSIYETGTGTDALKRTAEELSTSQISSMRMQSSRFSLLAIIFIAVSALIPSFFTVFAAVTPAITAGGGIEEWQMWLAFLVAFPLLDIAALGAMFFLLPASGRKEMGGDALLEEYLGKAGFAHGRKAFLALLATVSLALAAVFAFFGNLLLFALSLCVAPAIYFLVSYLAHREVEAAEWLLPDALYSAAATHRIMSSEKMLAFLSKGGFGRISECFEIALHRQKAGESFSDSMRAAAMHCPSPLVERAFSLLIVSYETGANMYFALREAAQDVVSFFTLVRERAALLAVQRYTILASCSLLVPVILGTVVSLAPSLSSATLFSQGTPSGILASLPLACQAYLLLNAAISSVLLSLAETSPKRAALYFALSVPLSQAVFAVASSGTLPSA